MEAPSSSSDDDGILAPGETAETIDQSGLARTEHILKGIESGSDEAVGAFWTLYAPGVDLRIGKRIASESRPAIRAKLAGERDALVNEVFFKASQAIEAGGFEYRGPAKLRGWLHTIAASALEDRCRHWVARPDQPQPMTHTTAGWGERLARSGTGFLTSMARRESWHVVRQAIAKLSEEHQKIIELKFYQGATWAEVGAAIDKAPDAARMEFANSVKLALGLAIKLVEHQDGDEPPPATVTA